MENINIKRAIVAIMGALAVGIGAFGAHGLKPLLDFSQIETLKTATLYHFIHVLAMLVLVLYKNKDKAATQSFFLFLGGIICFSGSLYIISTRHLIGGDVWHFVGPITPVGGLLFILGWLNLVRIKL